MYGLYIHGSIYKQMGDPKFYNTFFHMLLYS